MNEGRVTFVLDIGARERWEGDLERIARPGMGAVYHRVLSGQQETGGEPGTCALTGTQQVIERGTFPVMKFPVIDNTILFAMNPDTDCHHRYGLIGSSICPIGKGTVDGSIRLRRGLPALSGRARHGGACRRRAGISLTCRSPISSKMPTPALNWLVCFPKGMTARGKRRFESAAASPVEARTPRARLHANGPAGCLYFTGSARVRFRFRSAASTR